MKDGQPLPASNRFNTQYDINTGVARLKISDSHMNDAGVYSVVAENKAGTDHTDGQLVVQKAVNIDNAPIVNPNSFAYLRKPAETTRRDDDEAIPSFPPKVIIPLSNVQTTEGKPVTLACKIDGEPKPTVSIAYNCIIICSDNLYFELQSKNLNTLVDMV